jgi:hypothetical protein
MHTRPQTTNSHKSSPCTYASSPWATTHSPWTISTMQYGKTNKEQTILTLPRVVKPPASGLVRLPLWDLTAWGRLDRPRNRPCTILFKTCPNHFEHLPNSPRCPNHAQTSPPCWQCMNQCKFKKCNLELLISTKFTTRCYTSPNEQVRYFIDSYEHKLQDHKVWQPLGKAKIGLSILQKITLSWAKS